MYNNVCVCVLIKETWLANRELKKGENSTEIVTHIAQCMAVIKEWSLLLQVREPRG